MDLNWFEEMEARIPKDGVRTRFAPSPTGYMHVGNLRTYDVARICLVHYFSLICHHLLRL